jgi:hypothetical protein
VRGAGAFNVRGAGPGAFKSIGLSDVWLTPMVKLPLPVCLAHMHRPTGPSQRLGMALWQPIIDMHENRSVKNTCLVPGCESAGRVRRRSPLRTASPRRRGAAAAAAHLLLHLVHKLRLPLLLRRT